MMKKILTLAVAVTLIGCYTTEFSRTNHPFEAGLHFDVVYPTLPDGGDVAGDMVIVFDDVEHTVDRDGTITPALPALREPGDDTYYIYTTGDDDTKSHITSEGEGKDREIEAVVPTLPDGSLDPNPDQLYFGKHEVNLEADTEVTLPTTTDPLIRQLDFQLELEGDAIDRLDSYKATLSGVTKYWDCINNKPIGTSGSIIISDSTSPLKLEIKVIDGKSYIVGTIYLLGFAEDEDVSLSFDLTFEDGNPADDNHTSDITDLVADFNSDKSTALKLENKVETPTESGSGGTIGDWTTTDKDVVAE